MVICHPTESNIGAMANLEAACFPPSEAASYERMEERVRVYPQYIWLLEEDGVVASFVIALRSDKPDLCDEMFASAFLHESDGDWLHVLSVATAPSLQGKGFASRLLSHALKACRKLGLKGSVLTCKEPLVSYYAQFGYEDEGISESDHGGAIWHQMRNLF